MPYNVGDPVLMKTRILAERCSTCILRPAGERLALTNQRLTEFIADARDRGSYVVCHSTFPGMHEGVEPAVCRGFADAYDTAELRFIRSAWGFVEVPAPTATTEKG